MLNWLAIWLSVTSTASAVLSSAVAISSISSFAATNDQKRIATPASALQDGASRLVIGRPITQAENPREAVRLIIEEMENVSK